MNQHPLGEHLASCSSPANCAEYFSILSMSPTEHRDWITQDCARIARLRTASSSHRSFRVSEQETFTPPDPYRDGLERLRRNLPSTRWPEPPAVPSPAPNDFTPPDAYQAGLDKMRRENR